MRNSCALSLQQQQAVAAATSAARAARDAISAELGGDFAETITALEKRLGRLQRQNESLRTSAGGVPTGNIPFAPTAGTDAESLVNEVLGHAALGLETPASGCSRPSLG